MNKVKTQWQKRVDVTQYIFSCLIKQLNTNEINENILNYNFDANQLKVIEYFRDNFEFIKKNISDNLKKTWTWDRLSIMEQSIMIVAFCEFKILKREKAIAIDQALVTADKYGQLKEKKFINAILDKILI